MVDHENYGFKILQWSNLRIASQAGKVVQFFGENPSLKRRIPPHWTTWSNFWMIWGTTIWGGSSISILQSATKNLHPELNKETSSKWIYMDFFFARMIWLVIDLPLWKIWKAVGMMTFPIYTKNKKCSKPPTSYCASGIFLDFCIGFQATTCSASGIWDQKLIWLCLKIGHSPIERLIIIFPIKIAI